MNVSSAAATLTKPRVRLYGALCVQRGTLMLQAYAPAEMVNRQGTTDEYDHATGEGYQRSLVTARVSQTADYYERREGLMPNPLLINIRADDFERVRIEVMGGETAEAAYNEAIENGGNWIGHGYIEFDPDMQLWIYDGQHRNAGLGRILSRNGDFEDFPVPISLTLGLDTTEEMTEFYEVNTNAKNVQTNLVMELLSRMAEHDPELRDLLEAKDRDWITRGNAVVKALQELDGPWKGRLQPPNQRKRKGDGVVIPIAQFIRSLKPVLDFPLLKRAEADTIANIINAYWLAIAQVLPEPFSNPEGYAIQKGQGTVALHKVLPQVIEVVRAGGGKLGDPAPYAEVLEDLPQLSGQTVDDGVQVTLDGAEFWKVGSVVSGFSGDAGRRRLGLMIQSLLPAPSDTITL